MPETAVVLLVVDHLDVAGPGGQVAMLAGALPEPFAAVVAAGTSREREVPRSLPPASFHEIPLAAAVHPLADVRAVVALRRLVGATGARVVHTHSPKVGALGRLAALTSTPRPRIVHSYHGHELDPHGSGAGRRALLELERRLARHSDVLVAASTEVRDELLALRVGRPEQYEVIPLGLDLERFRAVAGDTGALRGAIGLGADVPLAGIFGPLTSGGEHTVVLEALSQVPRAHLAVLGEGPLAPSLREVARQFGVGDRVHFVPGSPDPASLLADLDLVVLARPDPVAPAELVEALAAGRPVVAAESPGSRTLIEDGRTGWLCPPGNAGAFAWAIRQATSRPVEALARAARARPTIAERFGQDHLVAAHAALYQGLLSRDRQPPWRARRARGSLAASCAPRAGRPMPA